MGLCTRSPFKRDRPDLAERIVGGEMSANAGWLKSRTYAAGAQAMRRWLKRWKPTLAVDEEKPAGIFADGLSCPVARQEGVG